MLDSPVQLEPLEGRRLLSALALPLGKLAGANAVITAPLKHQSRPRVGLASGVGAGFAGAYRGSWTSDQGSGEFYLTIFTNSRGELYGLLSVQMGEQTIVQQSQIVSGRNGRFSFLYVSTQRIIRMQGRFNTSQLRADLTIATREGGMNAELLGRVANAPQPRP